MKRIKVTSKRQATLPKDLCDRFSIKPGDTLLVEETIVDGKSVLCLHPERVEEHPPWFGSLRKYAVGKTPSMEAIRNGTSGEGWD